MNIAIFIPSLRQGGAEKQAALLAATLSKYYNVDMFLLYGDASMSPQNRALLDRTTVNLHLMRGNILSKAIRLRKLLKDRKIDILFNYLTSCDVIGAIAGRLAGVDRIYSGIRNTRLERHKLIVDRVIHNHIVTASIHNSYSGATYFATKGFNDKKNIVIPNGFVDISEPIIRDDRDIKHIVTVGRFVPQKDFKTMIETISKLQDIRQDFVMDIVGYGVEEYNIRKWIEEFKVNNCVNIYIRPDNVQDILRNADIYLSTSLFEGTSNSIMEALNWSLPIVATNVGDNDCLVASGDNGMIHAKGDASGMAHSLSMLLDSIDLRNEYGVCGNKRLRTNYSMQIFEERYMSLIGNI